VKRLAVHAHCFASAGVPLALLHEAHLSSAVKRLAIRAHGFAIAGLRRSRTDARQVINAVRIKRFTISSFILLDNSSAHVNMSFGQGPMAEQLNRMDRPRATV
jgi:hypothetical protein